MFNHLDMISPLKNWHISFLKEKTCPKCGEQMKKDKCCETIDGSVYNTNSVPLYIQGRQVKHYFYRFTCQECGAEFTLTELSK